MCRSEMKSPSASCQQSGKHCGTRGRRHGGSTRPHRRRWRGCSGKQDVHMPTPRGLSSREHHLPRVGTGQRQLCRSCWPAEASAPTAGSRSRHWGDAQATLRQHPTKAGGAGGSLARAQRGPPLPAEGQPPVHLPRLPGGVPARPCPNWQQRKGTKDSIQGEELLPPLRDRATPAASDDARTIGAHPPPPPHARPLSTTLSQVTALSVSCGSAWCPRRAVLSARMIRSAREPGEGMGLSRDQGSTLPQPQPCTSTRSVERSSEAATANNRQCLDQDTRQRQETKGMNETGTHQERPRGGAGQGSWTHTPNTVVSTAQPAFYLSIHSRKICLQQGGEGSTVFGNKNRKGRIETRRPEMAFPSA